MKQQVYEEALKRIEELTRKHRLEQRRRGEGWLALVQQVEEIAAKALGK